MIEVVIKPRTERIADLIDQCARGELEYGDLCDAVIGMGYNTASLFEKVRAAEHVLQKEQS